MKKDKTHWEEIVDIVLLGGNIYDILEKKDKTNKKKQKPEKDKKI